MPEIHTYPLSDYTALYKPIMQFNKNKTAFIHQWYPFVEGYSKEFITSIIGELDYEPECALDPFAGSGTTPVELQEMGIKCYSFEVSPFMHLLATVKLEREYNYKDFSDYLIDIGKNLNGKLLPIRQYIKPPIAKTFQPNSKLKKWIFNVGVMNGLLDIKYFISKVPDLKYRKLFNVAFASILLDVSNVYRNGKCLSYKEDWNLKVITRRTVHKKFLDKLTNVIGPDIELLEEIDIEGDNCSYCTHADVRTGIGSLPDNSIDLVITSPPYLNSRDYTDIYIVELWMLDLINDYDQLRKLRFQTLRSHVQVKIGDVENLDIRELNSVLSRLGENKDLWNNQLPGMIKGYFKDMDILFSQLKRKMKPNKKVFFNVANSAYYNVEIKVDEIVAAIAEKNGFVINEIREARQLKPSSQQKDIIKSLRESVIVMTS